MNIASRRIDELAQRLARLGRKDAAQETISARLWSGKVDLLMVVDTSAIVSAVANEAGGGFAKADIESAL